MSLVKIRIFSQYLNCFLLFVDCKYSNEQNKWHWPVYFTAKSSKLHLQTEIKQKNLSCYFNSLSAQLFMSECVCLSDYYTLSMLGLKTDQEVLGELVKMKIPAVWKLLQDHGVMWTLLVSRWFICLYIDVLPVEVQHNTHNLTRVDEWRR